MGHRFVTHACGHEVRHSLAGAHRERDREIARLEKQPCSACGLADSQRQARERRAAVSAGLEVGIARLEAKFDADPSAGGKLGETRIRQAREAIRRARANVSQLSDAKIRELYTCCRDQATDWATEGVGMCKDALREIEKQDAGA